MLTIQAEARQRPRPSELETETRRTKLPTPRRDRAEASLRLETALRPRRQDRGHFPVFYTVKLCHNRPNGSEKLVVLSEELTQLATQVLVTEMSHSGSLYNYPNVTQLVSYRYSAYLRNRWNAAMSMTVNNASPTTITRESRTGSVVNRMAQGGKSATGNGGQSADHVTRQWRHC